MREKIYSYKSCLFWAVLKRNSAKFIEYDNNYCCSSDKNYCNESPRYCSVKPLVTCCEHSVQSFSLGYSWAEIRWNPAKLIKYDNN